MVDGVLVLDAYDRVVDVPRLVSFHDLTAVVYEGSHVRTQRHVTQNVCITNNVLFASLTPLFTGTNVQIGATLGFSVDANTNFFFRTPGNALADATPIGTGTAFLSNIVRGFKVHVSVVDPLASPLVAKTVDIEIAKYDGTISGATAAQFTYNRAFTAAITGYTVTLPYCAATAKNGKDASGNQILGYKWWNFTFPTLADTGATAIPDFVNAVGGSASFGPGASGAVKAWGTSYVIWGDGATPLSTGWSAKWTVLEPTMLPRGTVAAPWTGSSFGLLLPGGPAHRVASDGPDDFVRGRFADGAGHGGFGSLVRGADDGRHADSLARNVRRRLHPLDVRRAGKGQLDRIADARYIAGFFEVMAPRAALGHGPG